MNGLAVQVQEALDRDPHTGDLYVFRGRRGDLIKILWHDELGMSLYAKTWALGVYHGLRRKHFKVYLDEFVFRFNRRHTRHASFASLLRIAVTITPRTYNQIVQLGSTG